MKYDEIIFLADFWSFSPFRRPEIFVVEKESPFLALNDLLFCFFFSNGFRTKI